MKKRLSALRSFLSVCPLRRAVSALALAGVLASVAAVSPAFPAEAGYRNRDNPDPDDPNDGTYPIPYHKPTRAEIVAELQKVRGYLDSVARPRVIDRETGREITDPRSEPVATAYVDPGSAPFSPLMYEMGVVHAGMLRASEATGDPSFAAFTERQLRFVGEWLPYFRAQEEKFHLERRNSFRGAVDPRSLDDSGSMCAALIRAQLAGIGPDMQRQINVWSDYILNEQFRFPDGTLARQRPQPESLWADDAYMSIPALAEMGRLTGEKKWFDDAVRQVLQMSEHLFVSDKGLYTHGLHRHNPVAPHFFWGRANGWIVVATCDLLDVLPREHPGFEPVRKQLEAVLLGVSNYQSGTSGLWHQMLDRNNSYLETSATAMFVYGLARAINQGWISPTTYGSIAQAGWIGLTTRIAESGAVEGTCVGTTLASDQVYYYHRPVSQHALHGYGPVLLAGSEMIRLLENPKIDIQYRLRTYHYVPKGEGPVSYREHD